MTRPMNTETAKTMLAKPRVGKPRRDRARGVDSGPKKIGFGAVVAVLVAFGACEPESLRLGPREILHPNAENAPPRDASIVSGDSLPKGLSPAALLAWTEARRAIVGARTVLRIGSKNQEGPDMFGGLTDAKIDIHGNVFVFDYIAQEVRVFDSGGRHLGGFGGRGHGPMELMGSSRIEVLDDGRIAVPIASKRLKVFVPDGQGWKLAETINLAVEALDVCATNHNQLYYTGAADQNDRNWAVHRISLSNRSKASFGAGYQHNQWIVRWRMSEGFVGCPSGNDPDPVIYGYQVLPIIRAHALDGSVIWTAKVTDHIPMRVIETEKPNGGSKVTRKRHIQHDLLTFVQALPSGHVFLQYTRFLPKKKDVVHRSFLLDAATGIGAFLGDSLPAITMIQPEGYVAVFHEPYPRLEVRKTAQPALRGGSP